MLNENATTTYGRFCLQTLVICAISLCALPVFAEEETSSVDAIETTVDAVSTDAVVTVDADADETINDSDVTVEDDSVDSDAPVDADDSLDSSSDETESDVAFLDAVSVEKINTELAIIIAEIEEEIEEEILSVVNTDDVLEDSSEQA